MKLALFFASVAIVDAGSSSASRPTLSISLKDGSFKDSAAALSPALKWSSSSKSGDVTFDYGVEADAKPTADLASLPRSVWGKASKKMGAWAVSARAEIERDDMSSADVEINAVNNGEDLSVKVDASAGDSFAVSNIEATKGFDAWKVNPRYDLGSKTGDVVVSYASGKTELELVASKDEQEVTVSQQLDSENKISPTFALRSGKMSVEWEKSLSGDNSITTTLKPNESLEVEWNDSAWTANVAVPIQGSTLGGATVSVSRDVEF